MKEINQLNTSVGSVIAPKKYEARAPFMLARIESKTDRKLVNELNREQEWPARLALRAVSWLAVTRQSSCG